MILQAVTCQMTITVTRCLMLQQPCSCTAMTVIIFHNTSKDLVAFHTDFVLFQLCCSCISVVLACVRTIYSAVNESCPWLCVRGRTHGLGTI